MIIYMEGYFSGVNALILSKLAGFSGKSAEIIKTRIEENGGNATFFEDTPTIADFTHIIVPNTISKETLDSKLGILPPGEANKVVTPEWAYISIAKKQIQPAPQYTLRPKRQRTETLSPPQEKKPLALQHKIDPLLINPSRVKVSNLNSHLTDELEQLESYYLALGDKGRSIAYSNVICTLKLLPVHVTHISQLQGIKGIGPKLTLKIQEILNQGYSSKRVELSKHRRIRALESLTSIFGIGQRTANSLYSKGVSTPSRLKDYAKRTPAEFTPIQLDSIALHDELKQKLKRPEIELISEIIKEKSQKIDPNSKLETCGSYRRQREECGDIDIVIGSDMREKLLTQLISKLSECGLVTHRFTHSNSKFMGVVQIPGKPHRRLDIYTSLLENYPYAVLYFTGSTNYNRMIRLEAGKQGLHLSNSGLFELATGLPVQVPSCEDDIIKFLGLPVLTLKQRDV